MTSATFVAAWYAKFADLPVLQPIVRMPAMDGDIAWLQHLRDRIFDANPAALQSIPPDFIWQQTIAAVGEEPDVTLILLEAGMRRLQRVMP